MSSSSGLQRRRAAAPASDAQENEDGWQRVSRPQSKAERRASSEGAYLERHTGSGSVAAVDVRSGHRFAYDPRDMSNGTEAAEHPRLTLMEEVLLLGLKDKQGYLSFWNDNISYTLRGCVLLELAFRGRIATARGAEQKRLDVADRTVVVLNTRPTGEVLLDETLRLIRDSPSASVVEWVDLLSGETWNVMRINLQLKQVRERLAKGLVDKGVLRTEKRNFLLFDMPTHPLADASLKDAVLRRVFALLTSRSAAAHIGALYREEPNAESIAFRVTRSVCMVCAAYCGNVLENTLTHLSYETREATFQRVSDLLGDLAQWPMAPDTPGGGIPPSGSLGAMSARPFGSSGGSQSHSQPRPQRTTTEIVQAMQREYDERRNEPMFELIAGVLSVFLRMDALV